MNRPSEDIIDRVLNNKASAQDAFLVAKWFSTPEGQAYLSMRMDSEFLFQPDLFESNERNELLPDNAHGRIQRQIRRKQIRKVLYSAAAVLLPLAILVYSFILLDTNTDLFGQSEYREIYVPKGERIQVVFQDGSKVFLNSDTHLRYPLKFGLKERKVYLNGEAYFIIDKNPARPFVVQADSAAVQVLGTSFNMEAYGEDENISVSLNEGKVCLLPVSSGKTHNLEPLEKIIFNKRSKQYEITSYEKDADYSSMWKNNIIALKNKPLEDVMKILNRWYNVDFVLVDSNALKYSYTLMLSEETSLENVLSDLEKIAPVKFGINEKTVTVTTCNQ